MPALNFKKQFAPDVESGKKRQTIRACRKDGRDPKPGQTLYLYTGMRTKICRKLGEVVCKSVEHISLGYLHIKINNKILGREEIKKLALADGFCCLKDFRNFFKQTHGLHFKGYLIKW